MVPIPITKELLQQFLEFAKDSEFELENFPEDPIYKPLLPHFFQRYAEASALISLFGCFFQEESFRNYQKYDALYGVELIEMMFTHRSYEGPFILLVPKAYFVEWKRTSITQEPRFKSAENLTHIFYWLLADHMAGYITVQFEEFVISRRHNFQLMNQRAWMMKTPDGCDAPRVKRSLKRKADSTKSC